MKSDREYEYRAKTKSVLRTLAWSAGLGLFAVCGGVLSLAPHSDSGSRTVYLSEAVLGREANSAVTSCFGAVLLLLCATFSVLLAYVGVRMWLTRQRIVLTPRGVIVPGASRSAERLIEYGRIRSVSVTGAEQAGGGRYLTIDYDRERSCVLDESWLPSAEAFDEIHAVLKRRVEPARGGA
jgi:hypothetical protein